MSASPPDEFDGYRVLSMLGQGGMGQVYLAEDTLLDRLVAIKFILSGGAEDRERFLVEARAIARLQHPNVVGIYRIGEIDGAPYLVSEFVRGQALDALETPLPWARALAIGIEVARGLAAAHRRGVMHRDIKPGNVILSDGGQAKLLDFGLAKLVDIQLTTSERGAPESLEARQSRDKPLAATRPIPLLPRAGRATPSSSPAPAWRHDSRRGAQATAAILQVPAQAERSPTALTHAGTIMGTPDYLAPEVWRGEPSSFRSDVYALGALLFELCTGTTPYGDQDLETLHAVVQSRRPPRVRDLAPEVDCGLAVVVNRCLDPDPTGRFASGDALREALEQLTPQARRAVVPEGNPYRGLRAFEAEHGALFFGRDAEVRAVVERLRCDPFVLVAGSSGLGKSSLCHAGVIPAVASGGIDDKRRWTVAPIFPGKQPLGAIAAALAPILGLSDAAIVAGVRSDASSFVRELRRCLGAEQGLIVFVDQLEELLTVADADEAASAADFLGQLAVPMAGVRLLATVRGDFLTDVAALPPLTDAIARALYLLRPLTRDGIRDAIVGPASAKGVGFERDELVTELVAWTADNEGGLPLLQFALTELWEARDRERQLIRASALDAIGGVAGALARQADAVLAAMPPPTRGTARHVMLQLVTAAGTRMRRTDAELCGDDPVAAAAVEALVRGRLLVAREGTTGVAYEIAHEALVHGWPTLRAWLDEDSDLQVVRERLAVAAAEWERLGRAPEALWSSRQLAEVAEFERERFEAPLRAFLDASARAARRKRWAQLVVPLAVVLTLSTGGTVTWAVARRNLSRQVALRLASARSAVDEARRLGDQARALRGRALTTFDGGVEADAEAAWAQALARDAAADYAWARAGQALEAALTVDGSRRDVRALLATVLLERVLSAERNHRGAERDELLARLVLYDQDGELRRRLNAPARIDIDSTPAGATVALERVTDDDHGRPVLEPLGELGRTPLGERTLAAGSYVLTFAAPGHVSVRYPFLAGRGEHVALAPRLPRKGTVPPGFVYIPSGRFRFGTAAEENVRRGFLNATPVHEASTEAFLIARTETTYTDWIAFLEALPRAERARRTPQLEAAGMAGALSLRRLADARWQLTLKPAALVLSGRSGEKLLYPTRKLRREVDWLRLPVSAISANDAEAYVRWLDDSGRVPGARLCRETEWERAARGADDREYPHGDRLDPDDANFELTYGKDAAAFGPDEVGSHPLSRSPFAVDDLAGNVWEWTRSSARVGEHVIRGGSYYQGNLANRSTNRQPLDSSLRDLTVGLRVCATPR